MKPKSKDHKSNRHSSEEEFFQIPRAERLLQQDITGQIGDRVTNPSVQMKNRFTLQAGENHMQGAGIQNGDYLVVEKKNSYEEGSILAVKLGNKQLVRRYFRVKGRIHLQCDPPSQQMIIVDEQTPDFRILGQVVQIIREIG